MAGPLIEMLQGLQSRRQRRRSGWGGGDAPGMRDMINPLDSQDMADRSQGADISSSLPSTRLEARISEPAAESFATSRLPRPAASSTVEAPEAAPQARERSPFMTAAGSNAAADPVSSSQYPRQQQQYFDQQATCTGPNCRQGGENVISERVTHINGVPVGGSQQPSSQAGSPAAPTTAGAVQPEAWSQFTTQFKNFANDPKSANWVALARITADQSEEFNRLANMAPDIATKHFYRKQAIFMGMEAINSVKASIMQADAARREAIANRSIDKDTIAGQSADIMGFLTADNPEATPEYRAALQTGRYRQLSGLPGFKTLEEMEADTDYQNAVKIAYASDIARLASANAAAGKGAWGVEEDRNIGMEVAWTAAKKRYGAMPFEAAQKEIESRFFPAYAKSLAQLNQAKPEDQRLPQSDINQQARQASVQLWSHIYHDQKAKQEAEAASQPQQSTGHPYLRNSAPAAAAPASRGQSLKRNTEWMK